MAVELSVSQRETRESTESSGHRVLHSGIERLLRCPTCRALLRRAGERYRCTSAACALEYPVIEGVPVLVDERTSLFTLAEIAAGAAEHEPRPGLLRRTAAALAASGRNLKAVGNYRRLADLLLQRSRRPRVLVIGGRTLGFGMDELLHPSIELVETDMHFGPRTALICDAHHLPFEDGSFDGAVAQAVLEHVPNPYRCVRELHRVLAPDGLVYAETPFMQQVHAGRYDFTRLTHLGHRRLFRSFREIGSGATAGPATALAWAYRYLLVGFAGSPAARRFMHQFASLTSVPLRYLDRFLIDRPISYDAASAYYFIGEKSQHVLTDRELVALYRGVNNPS